MEDGERQHLIEEVVQPVLLDHGLTLVDLEWRGHRPRGVLRLFVDKSGGVGIDDCQRVSREIGDVLDASAVLAEEAYDLEVSSPGLERQLRKDRELRWAVGKRVRCWLAGGEEVRGTLAGIDGGKLALERDGQRVDLDRASITKVQLDAEVPWPRRASSGT
jgi:ribosome maturation factor RimP